MPIRTNVQPFFDLKTLTACYIFIDVATNNAAVIDPLVDGDFKSGRTDTKAVDALLAYVRSENLTVQCIVETHAHANHVSGADYQPECAGGETVTRKVFKKRKTRGRDIETSNAHHAVNSDKCPRTAAISGRCKRSGQLEHPAQGVANSEVA